MQPTKWGIENAKTNAKTQYNDNVPNPLDQNFHYFDFVKCHYLGQGL